MATHSTSRSNDGGSRRTLDDADPARPDGAGLASRGAAILLGAALFLVVAVAYAGEAMLGVLGILLFEGMLACAWLASAALLGQFLLRRLGVSGFGVATAGALGLGLFSLAALGLGLAGGLSRFVVFALLALGPALSLIEFARRHGNASLQPYVQRGEAWLRAPAGWGWLWVAAVPFLAIAAVAATLPPGVLWPGDPHPYDVLEYHLQVPREWYEAGRIGPLHHNVFSFFPMNVEVHYLLAMHARGGPWAAMYLAQFLTLGHALLFVLAAAEGARTPRGRAAAGLLAASTPWVPMLGSVAYNEPGLLLYCTLAIVWLLRATHGTTPRRSAALAGVFAGLACGAKLTAVPLLLVCLPAALLLAHLPALRRRRAVDDSGTGGPPVIPPAPGLRPFLLASAFYVVVALATFSPWLLRTARWAGGNPVFPEAMSVLGKAHFSDVQVERWRRAHAPRADQRALPARLDAAWGQIASDWRYAFIPFPLALLAGIVGLRSPHARTLLLLLLLTLAFWLAFTHLQSRFFVFAIPLAALLVGNVECLRWALAAALLVPVSAVVGFAALHQEFAPRAQQAREGIWLIGFPNLALILPEHVQNVAKPPNKVILVGDAKAYLYPLPMADLRYRTVFDVDNASRDTITAWLGGELPASGGWYVLEDPDELRRFERTYHGIVLPDSLRPPPPR